MPDVLQRLLVHLLVLENREHGLGPIEQRMTRPVEHGACEDVLETPVRLLDVRQHPLARRPLRTERGLGQLVLGVDPAREEHLEVGVDARFPSAFLMSVFTLNEARCPS